jgi:Tol biopolymer transport system component
MNTLTYRMIAAAALLGLSVSPALAQSQKPSTAGSTRPSKQYTIEQFLDTVSIAGASFSSDESRILFSSNKTGIWNVYSVAASGGEWTQITNSTTDSTYAVSYFPKDDRILLTRPGWKRAQSPLRARSRRAGTRPDAG